MGHSSRGESKNTRATDPLAVYLNDHLLGATSGGGLARRIADQHAASPAGQSLARIAAEIDEDRAALLDIMRDLEIPIRRYKIFSGWILEKASRAKPNGLVLRRAALSSLMELEAMRLGVEGKALMWRSLTTLDIAPERLDRLLDRARNQADTLEALRVQVAARILMTR